MNQPILTLNQNVPPFSPLSAPITFSQTVAMQGGLPVLAGDYSTGIVSSDVLTFRLYNNCALSGSNVAPAYNVSMTTYDGSGVASQTAATSAVSQMWLWIQESGWGENSSPNVLYTRYPDAGEYVGGAYSVKVPTYGSNGIISPWVRAGSDGNGAGMIEFNAKVSPSLFGSMANFQFSICISYDWSS